MAQEAIEILSLIHETSTTVTLIDLIQRPQSTDELRRRSLQLFAKQATSEDLQQLTSVPSSLQEELAIASQEIRQRERSEPSLEVGD